MAAKITYTAVAPNGEAFTRTTGTMAYVAVLMTKGPGQLMGQKESGSWGPYSWHKSYEAARAASQSAYMQQFETVVVDAEPTAVKGKAEIGDFAGHVHEAAINELIEAKTAKPRRSKKAVAAEVAEPEQPEVTFDDVVAAAEALNAQTIAKIAEAPVVDETVTEVVETAKPAKAAKKPAVPTERTLKQQLGTQVHAVVLAALDAEGPGSIRLPEGMSYDDAAEIVGKWLSYIPTIKQG